MKIEKGHCTCGEVVHKEYNSKTTIWVNGDRYFYPEDTSKRVCIFRCRGCSEPIHETFTTKNK